jgi:TIR domain/Domain of unknown function (DUF4062)
MKFEKEAFISYAHLDNVELIEGTKGWITNLHRALEVRLAQLLGKQAQIWRDPKLNGNDVLDDVLVEQLRRAAALIAVVSPRYVKSEWTRKELAEFWKIAEEQGGVRFHDKARIFKVLKTPVPLDIHPPELRSLLGYEFFKVDPDSGRVHELNEIFGAEAQRDFWLRLDDLAHDICCVVEILETTETTGSANNATEPEAIFLAEVTADLREQRETLRRDLEQHGYTVLPSRPLPLVESELKQVIREDLARCRLSIHLVGKGYGRVPEGSDQSVLEIQNKLATARSSQGGFSRLLWLPRGLEVTDERQRRVIEQLRIDPGIHAGADLLETSVEDLRTLIQKRLQPPSDVITKRVASGEKKLSQLYLIYDQRNTAESTQWADYLFEQGLEVLHPVFEGDQAEVREYHEENLRTCDAALILFGGASECWLRRKLRELQKSAGYGRTKPAPIVGVAVIPPKTPEKERFRTHEALVIPQFDGFSPDSLQPFLSRLRA